MTKLRGKTTIKVNAMAYAHLVELMLDGTHSCQELARATGLHYVTVLDYTRAMHRAGAAHILCLGEGQAWAGLDQGLPHWQRP